MGSKLVNVLEITISIKINTVINQIFRNPVDLGGREERGW